MSAEFSMTGRNSFMSVLMPHNKEKMTVKAKLKSFHCLLSSLVLILILIPLLILKGRILELHLRESSDIVSMEIRNQWTCTVPRSGFRSWLSGVVTSLKPEIKRECKRLFEGDVSEVKRLESGRLQWRNALNDSDLLKATVNCSFVREYFNNNLYVTRQEYAFPIAFVFIIYNSPQQVVRLLRLLYRPHNQYCIHPDLTSGPDFIDIFKNIAGCLDNVHVASKLQDVEWGKKSIMESIMGCYQDLIGIRERQHEEEKWKYVINLCGKELPLKSNHEIISHLLALNGTSMINGHLVGANDKQTRLRLWKKKAIPHSIPYAKGSAYMALSSDFVKFLLTDRISMELYNYFKNCTIPEEHYFATVYMMPDIPGGFNPNLPKEYLFITSRYLWDYRYSNKNPRIRKRTTNCHGNIVHLICIVDIGDLRWIVKSPGFEHALFQNKYFMEDDHLVMDCMEEKIVTQNQVEYKRDCQPYIDVGIHKESHVAVTPS